MYSNCSAKPSPMVEKIVIRKLSSENGHQTLPIILGRKALNHLQT